MGRNLHKNQTEQLSIDDAIERVNPFIIDVRAPMEYAAGNIPGSVNLPLLDDQERHLIGILYKQDGPEAAVDQGYKYLEPKENELARALDSFPTDRPWAVLCARGGMRSRVMTSFINHLGSPAVQLTGGYKAYRTFCLNQFETQSYPNLVVLHGQTGVGKTLVIQRLTNSLDLEGIANHRGSMFGGVGLKPRSQKNFEGLLTKRLRELDWGKPVFVEGESRKIGQVSIPPALFTAMGDARNVLLEAPLALRSERTRVEYIDQQPECADQIRELVSRLYLDLGHARVGQLLEWFDSAQYDRCFGAILSEYYDLKYNHTLKKLKFESVLDTSNVTQTVQALESLN